MQKVLGMEYASVEARVAFLRDNCDSVEEKGYMKPFNSDEMAVKKEELANVSIQLAEIEVEKKLAMDALKAQEKPLKEVKNVILQEIKNKATYVKEDLFKFIDLEAREVGFYNAQGQLVEQRPAFGNELQGTIFNSSLKAIGA
jgi:hypothetical protein